MQDPEGKIDDKTEEKVWVKQLPDIVINYHSNGYCICYKKFNSNDIYMCKNEMEGHDLRKKAWKDKIQNNKDDADELEG